MLFVIGKPPNAGSPYFPLSTCYKTTLYALTLTLVLRERTKHVKTYILG